MQRLPTLNDLTASSVWNRLIQGLSQPATGTEVELLGVPAWALRVTVVLAGVRTNGQANKLVQIGSGAIQRGGYDSAFCYHLTGTGSAVTPRGFGIYTVGPDDLAAAQVVLTRVGDHTWVGCVSGSYGAGSLSGGGAVTLDGPLDRIRLTTDGEDEFVAGFVSFLCEG